MIMSTWEIHRFRILVCLVMIIDELPAYLLTSISQFIDKQITKNLK
jgi:hypothetical protein